MKILEIPQPFFIGTTIRSRRNTCSRKRNNCRKMAHFEIFSPIACHVKIEERQKKKQEKTKAKTKQQQQNNKEINNQK